MNDETALDEIRARLARLEARQTVLEENFADVLEEVDIEEVLDEEDAWWYQHEDRRAKLGRKMPPGRLKI